MAYRLFIALWALVLVCATAMDATAESYKFKVNNTTESTIVKLLLSEDGKTWGNFDVGKGIPAGESAVMEWDESTNDQSCAQKVKAVYQDGSESEPSSFDFCEKDLELDF